MKCLQGESNVDKILTLITHYIIIIVVIFFKHASSRMSLGVALCVCVYVSACH